jgi:hypothetical protein
MANYYSNSLGLILQNAGENANSWGNFVNINFQTLLEQAIVGQVTITMANADKVLSSTDGAANEARNAVLIINGSQNATYSVIVPAKPKIYIITNNLPSPQIAYFKVSGSSIQFQVANGSTVMAYCTGSTVAQAFFPLNSNSISGNLTVDGNVTSTKIYYNSQAVSGINVASPGVVTLATTTSGLVNNTPIFFTLASGATLPTGLSANTVYYVTNIAVGASTTFNLTSSIGGSAINTTGSASTGTVTLNSYVYSAITSTTTNYVNAVGSIATNSRFYPAVLTDATTAPEQVSSVASISVNPSKGSLNTSQFTTSQTTTITIASPGVFTVATAPITGTAVYFETTGALPTGLTAGTTYYVRNVSSTDFYVSSTLNGTPINTSGTQSGTHTMYVPISTNGTATNIANGYWTSNPTQLVNAFTGSISSTILTVTAPVFVTVRPGATISGTNVTPNTQILNQLTSTASAVVSPTYSSGGAIGAYTFVVSSATSIQVSQLVTGTGLASGTLVTAINGTTISLSNAFTVQAAGTYNFYASGGAGTYTVSASSTASSTSITQSYAKLYFTYNGTNVASIDPLGNFIASGNVTAYGTP